MKLNYRDTGFLFTFLFTMGLPISALSQDSAISYQGQLRQTGEPFTGTANLEFRLFDQLVSGTEVASAQTLDDWPVEDGLFQVELDFGTAAFDGSERFLEIRVDGAALNPRQKITATPYALFASGVAAGSVDDDSIDPTAIQLRVVGSCPQGEYVRVINQNGSVVCGEDESGSGETGWSLSGNAGTDSSTDFIGTTDATPLELRTASVRSLRIEPSSILSDGIPITTNIIAGSSANQVSDGVRGATIAGGGAPENNSDPDFFTENPNRVLGHYGTVSGGYGNVIGDFIGNPLIGALGTIGGGANNRATGEASTVSGGSQNDAEAPNSVVGGGRLNDALSADSTISGGRSNSTSELAPGSTISGGVRNATSGARSTVGGGENNIAAGAHSFVGGGERNSTESQHSAISGGEGNIARGNASSINGGFLNIAEESVSSVGGGSRNAANGVGSSIGGGRSNTASGENSTVGGGFNHEASGENSTIGGGFENQAIGLNSAVGGGRRNQANSNTSVVSGGINNTASGLSSTVSGGELNCAGGHVSWAGGSRAKVRPGADSGDMGTGCLQVPVSSNPNGDEGTFIWADSQQENFVSTGSDQFLVRAQGGVGFGRAPTDYFEIQTPFGFEAGNGVGPRGVLRVRLNGNTQLRMFANGGLGIGSSFNTTGVPERGLRISGITRLGTLGSAGTTQLCRNGDGEIASCSSSGRYKTDIEDLDLGLDTILALAPVSYRWTSDNSADIGFVAEEVAKLDERLITRNAEGEIEGVRYDRISAVLANAAKEMTERDQRNELALQQLEAENARLRDRLAHVESVQVTEMASIKAIQDEQLSSLREELALLRQLIAPRVAQEAP